MNRNSFEISFLFADDFEIYFVSRGYAFYKNHKIVETGNAFSLRYGTFYCNIADDLIFDGRRDHGGKIRDFEIN